MRMFYLIMTKVIRVSRTQSGVGISVPQKSSTVNNSAKHISPKGPMDKDSSNRKRAAETANQPQTTTRRTKQPRTTPVAERTPRCQYTQKNRGRSREKGRGRGGINEIPRMASKATNRLAGLPGESQTEYLARLGPNRDRGRVLQGSG